MSTKELQEFRAKQKTWRKNSHAWTKPNKKERNKKHSAKIKTDRNYWLKRVLSGAKRRAKLKGIPFNLSVEDVFLPERCPVLNTPFTYGCNLPSSPSLDRIKPEKGYVPENVKIISKRANMIKNDASAQELLAVYRYVTRGR